MGDQTILHSPLSKPAKASACVAEGGVMKYYLDLEDDTGQIGIMGLRCTSCGDAIDSVILRNRLNPMPDLLHGVKQRKYAQRIDHGEAES